MKFISLIVVFVSGVAVFDSCEKESIQKASALEGLEQTRYFNAEIFALQDLKIYGKWELYSISGGFAGTGYDPDFDFLEMKAFGIYGFVRNDSLLEYGKVSPALQNPNDLRLKVVFEKDENSGLFFTDPEKYVEFSGVDTLHLNSPCCDRYNYHFVRVK